MKDREIWNEFEKYKSTYKKEQALKKLFASQDINSFEKVCRILTINRSQKLKHVLLEIAEVLEDRFKENPELSKLEAYQKYLKKEKLTDFKNYWYKKLYSTSRDSVLKTLETKVQNRYDKSKPGKFSLGVEFILSDEMYGHVMITCGRGRHEPYELSHLGFGYHTNLRSYFNSLINNQPFNQIHLDKKLESPRNLSIINGVFKFEEKIVNLISEFYSFHENIYEEFSKITVENFEENKFLNQGISKHWLRRDVRLILGILNVKLRNNDTKQISEFAKIGIKLDKYKHNTEYLNSLIK